MLELFNFRLIFVLLVFLLSLSTFIIDLLNSFLQFIDFLPLNVFHFGSFNYIFLNSLLHFLGVLLDNCFFIDTLRFLSHIPLEEKGGQLEVNLEFNIFTLVCVDRSIFFLLVIH